MNCNLQTFDWTSIGSIATAVMAIATFITLWMNRSQLKELKQQNRDLRVQNYESTLFFLIREFKESRERVRYDIAESNGYQAFADSWEDFRMRIAVEVYYEGEFLPQNKRERFRTPEEQDSLQLATTNYYLVVLNNIKDFNVYFNALLTVVRFVDKSDFCDNTKKQYFSFITNNISEVELKWIFYTCSINESWKDLRSIVEKWGLLSSLPIGQLIQVSHALWMSQTAFGNQKSNSLKAIKIAQDAK